MHELNQTTVMVNINKNPCWVTLSESLQNVELLKLKYFRVVDLPDTADFPPRFLFLDVQGMRDRPCLTTNKPDISWGSTTVSPPSGLGYPLYFKLEEQEPATTDGWNHFVIHGDQTLLGWHLKDLNRLSDFCLSLRNERNLPLTFGVDTVAMFIFEVHYRGKRNLEPAEQVKQYSRLHS